MMPFDNKSFFEASEMVPLISIKNWVASFISGERFCKIKAQL